MPKNRNANDSSKPRLTLDDWTKEDSAQASADGWDIFEVEGGQAEIQQAQGDVALASDDEARELHRSLAQRGDGLALKAMQIVVTANRANIQW